MRFLWTLGLVVSVLLGPAMAEVIPGQETPGFQAAAAQWLADDEAAALPELARLAREDNVAAQMLLALIDKSPPLQGPWLSRLPRRERVELMRAPGGLSGLSWMGRAAERTELAQHWLELWSVEARMALAIDFARAGESRAARETLVTLAARERRGFSEIATDPDYPAALRFFVWKEWQADPEMNSALANEIAALAPGDPQRALVGEPVAEAALSDWLVTAPVAAPVSVLCNQNCPSTARACARAAFDSLGSLQTLAAFGSPSESLIPAEAFNASPRGRAALLRRVLLNADARGRRAQLNRAREADACFADLLEVERQLYMPRRD